MNNAPYDYNANDFTLGDGTTPVGTPAPRNNTFAVLSLVFGILGVFIAACCIPVGILLGILAVVFGFVDKSKNRSFSPLAVAGAICGGVAIVLGLALFIYNLYTLANGGMEEYKQLIEDYLSAMDELD